MSKRLHLVASFAFTLLAVSPAVAGAQKITVEWEQAPLSHVVRGFALFAGRTIVVAPDVGDPAVTASVQNVDWQRALDLILAGHGLVARVDAAGNIRIEKQPSAPANPRGGRAGTSR